MGPCLSILCRILCICYWSIFSCWARHSVVTYQSLTFFACLVSLSIDIEWYSLVSLKPPDLLAGSVPAWCLRWYLPFRKSYLTPVWSGVETLIHSLGSSQPDFMTLRLSEKTKATPALSSCIFESGRRHFFENSIRMLLLPGLSPDPKPAKHCQGGPSCLMDGLTPERCHHYSG